MRLSMQVNIEVKRRGARQPLDLLREVGKTCAWPETAIEVGPHLFGKYVFFVDGGLLTRDMEAFKATFTRFHELGVVGYVEWFERSDD